MDFSSSYFLYLFLPVLLVFHFLLNKQFRNGLLLFSSLLFYAWGEGGYVLLMLFSILSNYFFGKWIGSDRGEQSKRAAIVIAIAANLGLLGFFKYTNFIMDNVNALLSVVNISPFNIPEIHLPIGISFFTFQAMSYVMDVRRGEFPAQKNLGTIALYISLFPQLIAGPIIRYQTVAEQLVSRVITVDKFSLGLRRLIIGLGKKVLIANTLGITVDKIFALPTTELTMPLAWIGGVFFMLQIYFDFSGYSDMAIGLGHMIGFTFPENFNYPYIAKSITDYWARWHISLTSWIRDYLFLPMAFKRRYWKKWGIIYAVTITYFFVGLWHGASWNYVIWGLYNGLFIILEREKIIHVARFKYGAFMWGYAMLALLPGYVFFRAETIPQALDFLSAICGFSEGTGIGHHIYFYMDNATFLALFAGVVGSTPVLPGIEAYISRVLEEKSSMHTKMLEAGVMAGRVIFYPTLLILCLISIAGSTYTPFIYFRF